MNTQLQSRCALCNQVETLRQSHIVPDFLYSPLYDDQHRFMTYGKQGTPDIGREQKGFRERLLCDPCEQLFCSWERPAADFINGAREAFSAVAVSQLEFRGLRFTRVDAAGKPTTAPSPYMVAVERAQYSEIKLFLLSVLWRMSVSTLHYFDQVRLGPVEEKIRRMLLEKNPGGPNEYPCELALIQFQGQLLTEWQRQPLKQRIGGKTFYRFFSSGVDFCFCASNTGISPDRLGAYCITKLPAFPWMVENIRDRPDLRNGLIKLGFDLKWARCDGAREG